MQATINASTVQLIDGDITQQTVDAIVTAANAALAGGGGVDGAVHQAGGPAVLEELRRRFPQGTPTGTAVATTAGRLPARFVIHAVGPVWQGGRSAEAEQLAGAVRKSLQLAVELKCRSVALPALSTGAYGFPMDQAAQVTIDTIFATLAGIASPLEVRIILWGSGAWGAFARALEERLDRLDRPRP